MIIFTPETHKDKLEMYKLGKYNADDLMCNLVGDNYPILLVMSRFGISLGFGDKSIGTVCRESG